MGTVVSRATRIAAAVLIAMACAAPVLAAEAAPFVEPASTDVQVWPGAEPGREVTVASVTLPEDTPLPAMVRIPIPPQAQVLWAGEIIGGDPAQDPKRDFEVVNGAGATYAQFVLEQARTGQIEAVGDAIVQDGEVQTVSTQWVQSSPSQLTGISVRLPAGATQVTIDPTPDGAPETNPQGESLYSVLSRQLKTGEATTVTASWKIVPVASPQQGAGEATNPLPLIGGLLAVAVVVLAIVLFMRRPESESQDVASADDDEDVEDSEDEDEPEAEPETTQVAESETPSDDPFDIED